ncbi:MAG TPA: HEAT repeat domain-containing protein [Acidobacteriota bacterium]|nr:HEAT repeat domain-containing protein [Acidobacteriota bacterium]
MFDRITKAIFLVSFFFLSSIACSTTAAKYPDESATLNERWNWAQEQLKPNQDHWIGYSISREMYEKEFIGSWYSDKRKFPTIYEVLTGKAPALKAQPDHRNVQVFANEKLTRVEEKDSGRGQLVTKEVALLFGYLGKNLDRVEVSLLDLQFDFRGRNLIWLGASSSEESVTLLNKLYNDEQRLQCKEELLEGIGVHRDPKLVVPILQRILNSNAKNELRAKAAFWLGTQNDPTALKVLKDTLPSETSEDVIEDAFAGMNDMEMPESNALLKEWTKKNYSRKLREAAIFWLGQAEAPGTLPLLEKIAMEETDPEIVEKAIFSMSEMRDTQGVTETLIQIAHTQPTREGRKHAIFWLSQNYNEKSASTLKDFVHNDPDFEVRKHALFALAELEDGQGIPELIKIAKNEKDPELRKQAIFWLGECDDERAQKALLQIIEDGQK